MRFFNMKKFEATTSKYELLPFKIDLQLFASDGDGDDANESQSGAVDSTDDESFVDDGNDYYDFLGTDDEDEPKANIKEPKPREESKELDVDIGSEDEDVADPQSKMTPEENRAYQKIRQKAEAEARASVENDKAVIAEQQKLLQQQIEVMQAKEIEQRHLAQITDEKIENLAYEKGYSTESAREILLRDARIAATMEINQQKQTAEINRLKKDTLRNDKYFKYIEPQIDALLKQDPNVDINGAYNYLLGEQLRNGKMDDLIQEERKSTQQRTVADIQDRSKRRSMSGGDASSSSFNPYNYLSKEDMKLADAWGVDKKELAKFNREQANNKKRR